MRFFCCCSGLVFSLMFVTGCGSPTAPPVTSPAIQGGTDQIKSRLQNISDSGSLGSALAGMKESIQKLPPDKSESLLKDLDDLQQPNLKPDKVKVIAKRMIDKL